MNPKSCDTAQNASTRKTIQVTRYLFELVCLTDWKEERSEYKIKEQQKKVRIFKILINNDHSGLYLFAIVHRFVFPLSSIESRN